MHNRTREFDSTIPEDSSGSRRVTVVIPVSPSRDHFFGNVAQKNIHPRRSIIELASKIARTNIGRSVMCATRIIETVPQNAFIVELGLLFPLAQSPMHSRAATATPKVRSRPDRSAARFNGTSALCNRPAARSIRSPMYA